MIVTGGLAMSFCDNQHLRNLCGLTGSLSAVCLGIEPGDLIYSTRVIQQHLTEKMIPELNDDLRLFSAESKIMNGGLPSTMNAFSQDVSTTKNWSFLDLSIRSIHLFPETSFSKNLISLQLLPKSENNQFKYDHGAATSADVNRFKMAEYGFLRDGEIRTGDPITTDRASAAQASAEYLSSSSEVCCAHFMFTGRFSHDFLFFSFLSDFLYLYTFLTLFINVLMLFGDAIKHSKIEFLVLLMDIMQSICRITRFSSLSIPAFIQVTRKWRAFYSAFKKCFFTFYSPRIKKTVDRKVLKLVLISPLRLAFMPPPTPIPTTKPTPQPMCSPLRRLSNAVLWSFGQRPSINKALAPRPLPDFPTYWAKRARVSYGIFLIDSGDFETFCYVS